MPCKQLSAIISNAHNGLTNAHIAPSTLCRDQIYYAKRHRLMDELVAVKDTYLEKNTQSCLDTLVGDTLVGYSRVTLSSLCGHSRRTILWDFCATLLLDTLVGHSRTTLTYSDVIWPHKLTVLTSSEATALRSYICTTKWTVLYTCQKLLPALNLYYHVTMWPVLSPQLPHLASRSTCVLHYTLPVQGFLDYFAQQACCLNGIDSSIKATQSI